MTSASSSLHQLIPAIERYFELMYDCDVSKFYDVFHETAALNGIRDGKMTVWPAAHYREVLATRKSPKSLNAQRGEKILLTDIVSDDQAFAKVRVIINGTTFVDYLTYLKVADNWKIAFKAYHVEAS